MNPATFVLQAFSEAGGNPSSMRLLCGLVVVAWLVVFVRAGWVMGAFPPVSLEHVGILALVFGAKVLQKSRETIEPQQTK